MVESHFINLPSSFKLLGYQTSFKKYSFKVALYETLLISFQSAYIFISSLSFNTFGRNIVLVKVLFSQAEFISSTLTVCSQ